jgi:hypothetical protein
VSHHRPFHYLTMGSILVTGFVWIGAPFVVTHNLNKWKASFAFIMGGVSKGVAIGLVGLVVGQVPFIHSSMSNIGFLELSKLRCVFLGECSRRFFSREMREDDRHEYFLLGKMQASVPA